MGIEIRQTTPKNLLEITTLFRETVSSVYVKDVWATGANDINKWEERI